MTKQIVAALIILFLAPGGPAQTFQFALVTDTHVGGAAGAEDLALTVADINQQAGISFVILAGDISEFGSDAELTLAKKILDRLNKPLFVVPGNHDSKWSESGCNSFAHILGGESFSFAKNGFFFIGTASGPNMRMAPGLVPREHLAFLDSALTAAGDLPIIFVNHYPLNDELANHAAVLRRLKQSNIQLSLLATVTPTGCSISPAYPVQWGALICTPANSRRAIRSSPPIRCSFFWRSGHRGA